MSTEAALVKKILGFVNDTDIPMMTAICKQLAYLIRVHLVQQIDENQETRANMRVTNLFFFRHSLVILNIDLLYQSQMLRGDCFFR
jgi:hypothetical protein